MCEKCTEWQGCGSAKVRVCDGELVTIAMRIGEACKTQYFKLIDNMKVLQDLKTEIT